MHELAAFRVCRGDPIPNFVFVQQNSRHSVMNESYISSRVYCNYDVTEQRLVVLKAEPTGPLLVFNLIRIGLDIYVPIDDNCTTASAFQETFEGRFLGQSFSSGIDHSIAISTFV
uniref:Uncharacterized protein n=1 Tax=Romanomermis culicivorax TaxID=13658 RepID=A0A915JVC7_ROMCU